jgi:hypothetical protein
MNFLGNRSVNATNEGSWLEAREVVMNRKQWNAKFEGLRNLQSEANGNATRRKIRGLDANGLREGPYPRLDQTTNDRSRLTDDVLLKELKDVKLRLDALNNLGPRPSLLVDRLAANLPQRFSDWLGLPTKDPREELGNAIRSFSSALRSEAEQEGLDFNQARIEADISQRPFTDLQRDLARLQQGVSQPQNAKQDPGARVEAVYAWLSEERRIEQQLGKFQVEQDKCTTEFSIFVKPSPEQLLEAKKTFDSLREQLSPDRESQKRLLRSFFEIMAEVQAMPKGPESDLNIDIIYNLALEEKLNIEKLNIADIMNTPFERKLGLSRLYEKFPGTPTPNIRREALAMKMLEKLKAEPPQGQEQGHKGVRI